MKTSPRPKARTPKAEIQGYLSGVEKEKGKVIDARRPSPKPMPRSPSAGMTESEVQNLQKKLEGDVRKYAKGGTVRGMGAAKRGGKFTRSA